MTEKAYRFSPSAIDKLNKHRGAPRLSTRQFTLFDGRPGCPPASAVRADCLVNTAVGSGSGGSSAIVGAQKRENTVARGPPRLV